MYCRFCGKEIKEDSKFCNYCGKEIEETKVEEIVSKEENSAKQDKDKKIFIITLCIVLFICFSVIFIAPNVGDGRRNNVEITSIFKTSIKEDDYSVITSQDLTTYTIYITPKHKFIECEVEYVLYDSKGKVIYEDTLTKKNMKKGEIYTFEFENGLKDFLLGAVVGYKVSGTRTR